MVSSRNEGLGAGTSVRMVVYSLLCKSGEVCRDPAHTGAPGLGIQAMQLRLARLEVSRASPGSHEMED